MHALSEMRTSHVRHGVISFTAALAATVTITLTQPSCNKAKQPNKAPQTNSRTERAEQARATPKGLRIPGRSVPVGHLAQIAQGVLSVAGLRSHVTDKGRLHFAAVLLETPKKGLDCLAKQAEHHESCPPPYFTFGDTEPYQGTLPKRLGARVLVMMNPQAELETHHTYVISGHWCHDRNLARFCGEAVWRIPDQEGRRFWQTVVLPSLPKRPKTNGTEKTP